MSGSKISVFPSGKVRDETLVKDYLEIRRKIPTISNDILMIFADGNGSVLSRLSTALKATHPDHPDLPVIRGIASDMEKAKGKSRFEGGPGKGKPLRYSIPLKDVPNSWKKLIETSNYADSSKIDMMYELREIMGAARRSGLPVTLGNDALAAYMAEILERKLSKNTIKCKVRNISRLCVLLNVDKSLKELVSNELRAAKLAASSNPSKRHLDFRASPLSPLDYARLARAASEEAYSTRGGVQTVQRLFVTAATLALLSFVPERVADIVGMVVGRDAVRKPDGWALQYVSQKTGVDRSFGCLPDQLTPFLDDLILLGAAPGPRGQGFVDLYRYREHSQSPLFARIDLQRPYSANRIYELVKERTGHGPHAARKAMTDYIAEMGGSTTEVLDLLGHRSIATAEKHYAVRAPALRRKWVLGEVQALREELIGKGKFRLPTGELIDLDRIARELDRA
ncbi:MAG: hypothetical protein CMJ75_14225 [Planctomycetaceae bacterium]|nr:hypothetical protein [Planctomycetaceae bacterium]